MNEQELRSLVREAIERHLGRPGANSDRENEIGSRFQTAPATTTPDLVFPSRFTPHASHIILKVAAGSEIDEGMCVIEPSVRCNHCGFCQSYGH